MCGRTWYNRHETEETVRRQWSCSLNFLPQNLIDSRFIHPTKSSGSPSLTLIFPTTWRTVRLLYPITNPSSLLIYLVAFLMSQCRRWLRGSNLMVKIVPLWKKSGQRAKTLLQRLDSPLSRCDVSFWKRLIVDPATIYNNQSAFLATCSSQPLIFWLGSRQRQSHYKIRSR